MKNMNTSTNLFSNLQYPVSFIYRAKLKAIKIYKNKQYPSNSTNPISIPITKYITLPQSPITPLIEKNLNHLGIKTVTRTSQTIKHLLKHCTNKHESSAGVYKICCEQCDRVYIGETARNLKKRLYEHSKDLKFGNTSNSLVTHNLLTNHNFSLQKSSMIAFIHNRNIRRIVDSSAISILNTLPQRPGFYKISPFLARIILKNFNIHHKIS